MRSTPTVNGVSPWCALSEHAWAGHGLVSLIPSFRLVPLATPAWSTPSLTRRYLTGDLATPHTAFRRAAGRRGRACAGANPDSILAREAPVSVNWLVALLTVTASTMQDVRRPMPRLLPPFSPMEASRGALTARRSAQTAHRLPSNGEKRRTSKPDGWIRYLATWRDASDRVRANARGGASGKRSRCKSKPLGEPEGLCSASSRRITGSISPLPLP